MGFIEDLRQIKEAEVLASRQQARVKEIARQAEEAAQLQRKAQEDNFREQLRKQAKAYYDESSVSDLFYRLSDVLHGEVCFERGTMYSTPFCELVNLPVSREDPDSIIPKFLRWDVADMGETMVGGCRRFIGKCIVIETCPDGTIIFHGNNTAPISELRLGPVVLRKANPGAQGFTKLPLTVWRNNLGILEDSLEKAYNHPRSYEHLRPIYHDRHIGMG